MKANKSIYGLVGNPVKHSLSPLMHNAAFKELDVDATYELFPLEEQELDTFFKGLKEDVSPIFGLNVTVPYKEKVLKYLDSLTPFAAKANAVNTLVIDEKRKLIGYNTDGPGFLCHVAELGIDTAEKRISILGAGGASRAIVCALCIVLERPKVIKIYDIESEKTKNLLYDLGQRIDVSIVEPVNSIDDLNIELADVLINTTPIGMKENDPCLVDESLIHSNLFVYDVVYNPAETKLLKLAREKGASVSNGLGMLYFQGVLAFQHWSNIELDNKVKIVMRKALENGLSKSM